MQNCNGEAGEYERIDIEEYLATTAGLAARQTLRRLTADTASNKGTSVVYSGHWDSGWFEDRRRLAMTSTGLYFHGISSYSSE